MLCNCIDQPKALLQTFLHFYSKFTKKDFDQYVSRFSASSISGLVATQIVLNFILHYSTLPQLKSSINQIYVCMCVLSWIRAHSGSPVIRLGDLKGMPSSAPIPILITATYLCYRMQFIHVHSCWGNGILMQIIRSQTLKIHKIFEMPLR